MAGPGRLLDNIDLMPHRFWLQVESGKGDDECWLWEGCIQQGYGRVRGSLGGRVEQAHRVAYELEVGPIPDGLDLDHTCHNDTECPGGFSCLHRRCVNPAHLEPVTRVENVYRSHVSPGGVNARKTHCIHGHPFDEANTIERPRGHRGCRTCKELSR
jgi:hypothetical protein